MAKRHSKSGGFGERSHEKENSEVKGWHLIFLPKIVSAINFLLVSLCSVLVVMITTRYGETKYMTSLSVRDLLPAFLPVFGGLALKIHSKKSFSELWKGFVKDYGKRWTLVLAILTVVLASFLYVISQHTFWMKRAPADSKSHEVLILLSKFEQISGDQLEPSKEWDYGICSGLQSTFGNIVVFSCQTIPQEIHSDKDAQEIGDAYKATLIIWGNVRGSVVEVHYAMSDRCGCSSFPAETKYTGSREELVTFVSMGQGDMDYVLNFVAAQLVGSSHNYQSALDFSDKALSLLPKDRAERMGEANLLSLKAILEINLGRIDEGIDIVRRVATKYPKSSEVYRALCFAYEQLGNYDIALDNCDIAVTLDPTRDSVYVRRAHVYYQLHNYELAKDDLNKAIEIAPVAAYFGNLSLVYLSMGDYQHSLSSVDHAIWLAPDNCILYSDRGDLYKLYGHTDWAMREYARALEVDAMCVSAREARASAYNDMKRYDDAITDLNEAIRLRESEPGGVWEKHLLISGLRVRGDLYMVQKRYNLAISDYTDMIGMSTSDEADTYRKRAIAYMSEHEYQKALDSLQPYLVKNQHPTSEILMLIEQLNGLLKSQP